MTNLIGIFWGAFDPPTKAHLKVISESLLKLPIEKLVIIINNHSYKKYTYSLNTRMKMIQEALDQKYLIKVEILFQDDFHKVDYDFLSKKYQKPLCAIAGSDSYLSWLEYSTAKERELYNSIVVIPRGNIPFTLQDSNAILLPIETEYRNISSTQMKKDG